jgi:CheY-like chemotaxis protein
LLRHANEFVLVSRCGPIGQHAGLKRTDLLEVLAADWASVTAATMRDDDETIGTLWVGRAHSGVFETHETELLQALADLTTLSISKLRAREQLRRLRDSGTSTVGASSRTPLPSAAIPAKSPPSTTSAEGDAPDAGGRPTVLVVDDSDRVLMQARLALQDTLTVLTASSGKRALETYVATHPAVVVVDLDMPEMDGWEVLEELRKLGCSTCVALALRGGASVHERIRKAGFLGVIEKPFRGSELQVAITAALTASEELGAEHTLEDEGFPVVVLPRSSSRTMAKLLPLFDRHLRALAEEGRDRVILDAAELSEVTPEHVAILVRLFAEARGLGIKTAICAPNGTLVEKLRQIVEIRDALYADSRDAAKQLLQ